MADSAIAVTAGAGTNVDTRTEATNGNHRQVVVLGDPATNAGVAPVDATNGLAVDVKAVVPGTGATALGKAIDGVTGATDTGVLALATRDDALTTLTPVDGDNVQLRTDSIGALHVKARISDSSGTVIDPPVQVAHDAADSGGGAPIKVGFHAKAGLSGATLVAAADRTNAMAGLDGALFVRHVPLEDIVSGNASNTDGTSTSVIATAGAGIKQYLTRVILTNMHVSSTVYVEMKSGTTVKATIPCPPGGATVAFDPPLPPNAADEAWSFDPSAATTTIYCTAVGFKSKI